MPGSLPTVLPSAVRPCGLVSSRLGVNSPPPIDTGSNFTQFRSTSPLPSVLRFPRGARQNPTPNRAKNRQNSPSPQPLCLGISVVSVSRLISFLAGSGTPRSKLYRVKFQPRVHPGIINHLKQSALSTYNVTVSPTFTGTIFGFG